VPNETATPLGTRERILDAAFDLFAELGFAGTRISQIEQRAGLAAGTGSFYRHFSSKNDLLPAAVQRAVSQAIAEARVAFPEGYDRFDNRELWLRQVSAYLNRLDRLIRLLVIDGERVPEVRSAIADALGGMSELISWEHDPSAVIGVAALHGYLLLSRAQGSPFYGVPEHEFRRVLAGFGTGTLGDTQTENAS
jgi:AcrR family transcriptional regulator